MGTITLRMGEPGTFGSPVIAAEDGRSILVQTDRDYPSIASTFGWDIRTVPGRRGLRNVRCTHDGTDGTIGCNAGDPYASCGTDAGTFIAAAYAYLEAHDGATAEDPGYFSEDPTM